MVEVLELLATTPQRGHTISDVSRLLDMSRSTCGAVLGALAEVGWVERLPDHTYSLGSGMVAVADAVRARLPILHHARTVLAGLVTEAGYGCTLTRVDAAHQIVVDRHGAAAQFPPGTEVGARFSLRPPYGAIAMAWRPAAEREAWLARGSLDDDGTARLRHLLEEVRTSGTGVWALQGASSDLFLAVQPLLAALAEHPARHDLRTEVEELLGTLGGHPYLERELQADGVLQVSYIVAPVFDADARARHEIELHVLRPSLPAVERRRLVTSLRRAAMDLTDRCGGSWPEAPATVEI